MAVSYRHAPTGRVPRLTLFNHKGGVGKTTLIVNIADALARQNRRVLLVDADPQCNLSAYYLREKDLDQLLGESAESDDGKTVWSAIKPVVEGRGSIQRLGVYSVGGHQNLLLAPGDVLLADYEEVLPSAWSDSFARKTRGYDVMCALSSVVDATAAQQSADLVIYDPGPNIGPLNRAILLDTDFLVTPVVPDLFSLRALTTVGRSLARWVADWRTVRSIASADEQKRLLPGAPKFAGYIISQFKAASNKKAMAHEYWEGMIAPRVTKRVVDELRHVDPALVPIDRFKLGEVPNYQALMAQAQDVGLAIASLTGHASASYNEKISDAFVLFSGLATALLKRMGGQ